ncbi:hypothetical protein [Arthrobacter sp. AZCC_0090]|uniref:hypothetical protein n=1 Tax=Arthrobacter sp. AZCC_0090 TaxID=2735881 RepID=UPI0016211FAC|nr:hypothetical protein [Arthrobacter sp. AZCC_0090]MBB6407226.1 hypothetical protein [Arthrobacter sp. AZCC_0090]
MSKPSIEDTAGHVVHLLERLDAPASAPQSLLLPKHLGPRGRVIFAFVNVIVTIAAVFALYFLWRSEESPGWWFNLIFTVMIGGIPAVLWAILIGTGEEARFDHALQAKWDQSRHDAGAEWGRVLARDIRLTENGSVSSFDLTVTLDDGSTLRGRWRPEKATRVSLLQSQVPGVGAEVRVWRIVEAGVDPSNIPVVIQAADASVVARQP